MANGLSWTLSIVDRMSGPFAKAARGAEALEKALAKLGEAKLPEIKLPEIKMPSIARAPRSVGSRKGDDLASIDKEWNKIIAAEQKKADKAAAIEKKANDRKTAEQLKTADLAKKAGVIAESHANADMLPKLDGLPKVRLAIGELELLKQKLREDKLAVTNLSASLRQMGQASSVDVGAMKLLQAELQRKKNSLAEIQTKLVLSGHAAKFGSEGTNRLTTTLRELAEAAGGQGITGLAGRLAAPVSSAIGLKKGIGDLGSALAEVSGAGEAASTAIVAVGAAALAATAVVGGLVIGLGALILKGAELALSASEAKNDLDDMLEAMLGSKSAADDLVSSFGEIQKVTSVDLARLRDLATQLSAAEVPANQLADSIRAIAQAESVLPDAGGKLQMIIEKAGQTGKFKFAEKQLVGTGVGTKALYDEIAKATGKTGEAVKAGVKAGTIDAAVGIAALNKVIDQKFGALAKKQAGDWSVITKRFRANVAGLFANVNTEPFTRAMDSIFRLVDQTTATGHALGTVLTDVFDGLFKKASDVIPYVRVLFKGLINIGLRVAVALEPLLINLGLVGETAADQQDPLESFQLVMLGISKAVGSIAEAINYVAMLDAPSLGKDLVTGLAAGLTSGIPILTAAATLLGKAAVGALRKAWDMHSPSKVGISLGRNFGGSIGIGADRERPAVHRRIEALAMPPSMRAIAANDNAPVSGAPSRVEAPRAASVSGAPGSRDVKIVVNFNQGSIVIQTTESGAAELRENMAEIFADVMEQAALKSGLAPTGTG